MLTRKVFRLEPYFNITNRYYLFFDGMFKFKDESKEKNVMLLRIPLSTYRLNKRSEKTIKNSHHKTLLKYFV